MQNKRSIYKCVMKHLHKDGMGHVYDGIVDKIVDEKCPECGSKLTLITKL